MTARKQPVQPQPTREAAAAAAAFLDGQRITTTGCRQCGTEISGVNGRYACSCCGWVNNWAEGDSELPGTDAPS
ncbi:hypothetical protein OHA87_47705 (plasmid) [Streptomyces sp. NBC_00493]|uniref:hypothetical protein n=1 Tax=Streptomyces sp. NBC_00493 TaxID=2975759 RepID=UPI002E17FB3E